MRVDLGGRRIIKKKKRKGEEGHGTMNDKDPNNIRER
jgi:hypothetical protein